MFSKLVRDKIPAIIRSNWEVPHTSLVQGEALSSALNEKIHEEIGELLKPGSDITAESADVLEVMIARVMVLENISRDEAFTNIMSALALKYKQRGGFEEGIILHMD